MAYGFISADSVGSGSAIGGADPLTWLSTTLTFAEGEHVYFHTNYQLNSSLETLWDGVNLWKLIDSRLAPFGDCFNTYECVYTRAGTVAIYQKLSAASPWRGMRWTRWSLLIGTSIVVGQGQAAPGTVTDIISSTNVTPGSQPGMLYGVSYNNAGDAIVAGTGFTSRGAFTVEASANGAASMVEDKRLTALTAVAATFSTTLGGADNYLTLGIFCAEMVAPRIDRQPASNSCTTGATVTFGVTATASSGALTYQWQDNSGGSMSNISGATSATYTTATTTSAFKGRKYQCVVTDSNGSTTTVVATLDVNDSSTALGLFDVQLRASGWF